MESLQLNVIWDQRVYFLAVWRCQLRCVTPKSLLVSEIGLTIGMSIWTTIEQIFSYLAARSTGISVETNSLLVFESESGLALSAQFRKRR